MGWFKRHQHNHAVEEWRADEAKWESADHELQLLLQIARTFTGLSRDEEPRIALEVHRDERVFWVGEGASLIEPRRLPSTWQGGSSGFSFPIAKGVRWRVGATRGHTVPGAEVPTPIDTGTATITNQRVVFQGAKQAREWAFEKLLGYQHDPNLPWTAIQVSNREKVSGILYDREHTEDFRFRLSLALANYHQDVEGFVQHLQTELADHAAHKPLPPPPA